jgi:hypothetical protein
MAGGRPSGFKAEFTEQAEKLAKLGATDMEIADFFEVDVRTINRWKISFPEFCQALKAGKDVADDKVIRSLFQRATGFEHEAVKIFMPANATEPIHTNYREFVVPDTTACIFWLKNRRPDEWRDKQSNELSGPNGGPIQTQEVKIEFVKTGGSDAK